MSRVDRVNEPKFAPVNADASFGDDLASFSITDVAVWGGVTAASFPIGYAIGPNSWPKHVDRGRPGLCSRFYVSLPACQRAEHGLSPLRMFKVWVWGALRRPRWPPNAYT